MAIYHVLAIGFAVMLEHAHDFAEMWAGFVTCIAAVVAASAYVHKTYWKTRREQIVAARVWLMAAEDRAGRPDFVARQVPRWDALPQEVQEGLMSVEMFALQAHDAARFGIEETTDFDGVEKQIAEMHARHSKERFDMEGELPVVIDEMVQRQRNDWALLRERHDIVRAFVNPAHARRFTKRAREWATLMLGVLDGLAARPRITPDEIRRRVKALSETPVGEYGDDEH